MNSEVQKMINELQDQCVRGNYLFRGITKDYGTEGDHPKPEKKVNSLLFRGHVNVWSEKFKPIHAEKRIVDKAKKYFSLNSSNIEILTNLRHYGGEVNLIDFSRDLYVALFFACHDNFEGSGELILLKADKLKEITEIDYNILTSDSCPVIIEPTKMEISRERVLSQRSIFIYAPLGYIKEEYYTTYEIKRSYKEEVLEYLKQSHNISDETIYNDIFGFIKNLQKRETDEKHETDVFNLHKGAAFASKGNYDSAIKEYKTCLDSNNDDALAYRFLGDVYSDSDDLENAIHYYSQSIIRCQEDTLTYKNRGDAQFRLGKKHISQASDLRVPGAFKRAISDYEKVIELNPTDYCGYQSLGEACKCLLTAQTKIGSNDMHTFSEFTDLSDRATFNFKMAESLNKASFDERLGQF